MYHGILTLSALADGHVPGFSVAVLWSFSNRCEHSSMQWPPEAPRRRQIFFGLFAVRSPFFGLFFGHVHAAAANVKKIARFSLRTHPRSE